MSAKPKRKERRIVGRSQDKITAGRRKLAQLAEGGTSDHPKRVVSASVIEGHALGEPCVACGSVGGRLLEHAAVPHAGEVLRRVEVRCFRCGEEATFWFRIEPPRLN